jgi:hypothetical protein
VVPDGFPRGTRCRLRLFDCFDRLW